MCDFGLPCGDSRCPWTSSDTWLDTYPLAIQRESELRAELARIKALLQAASGYVDDGALFNEIEAALRESL